ncbi:MAG: efflux RND transporter periplasmic adaptor subunit [Lentisphaeria bacterium]|nr:efflux RND transporter periplasmic adaptor subunit [Lentisphaeria bacterium]
MKITPVLAAAVGSLVLLSGCDEETPQVRTVPAVVVEPAIEMEFADTVTEVGEVQAYDTVGLSANVSGFLTEANFQEGELVKKGVKLFQIDPAVYDAAVRKAEADVNKYKAELTNKQVEFNRQKQMLKTKATSQRNYDSAEMNLRTAEAELKSAEAVLAEKKVDLGYTEITAPFDGTIGFKKYSVGNMVGPSSGALAIITAAGNVKIYFSIDELTMLTILENYPKSNKEVETSPKVQITLQNGKVSKEKVWISAWNNIVQDGTFRVQLTSENNGQLLVPGQYVKVTLQVSPLQKRIMVKQAAILREQLGTFVYVVNAKNKIERRKIVTGMKNGDYQVVVSGLKAGERIVVDGLQKIGNGDVVKPITAHQSVPGKQVSTQEKAAAQDTAPAQQKKTEAKK